MKIRRQEGMSLIGFLLVRAMVVFMVYMGMRITPIYLEYFSVVNAMDGLAAERGSAKYSPFDIKRKILDRLYVSYSDDNVKSEDIRIVRNNGTWVRVSYEVRKPMIGNIDVIASFDRQVMLSN
ncbi:MAG: DUF4845 domain-containing protein [Xanthomonadales bacterium]